MCRCRVSEHSEQQVVLVDAVEFGLSFGDLGIVVPPRIVHASLLGHQALHQIRAFRGLRTSTLACSRCELLDSWHIGAAGSAWQTAHFCAVLRTTCHASCACVSAGCVRMPAPAPIPIASHRSLYRFRPTCHDPVAMRRHTVLGRWVLGGWAVGGRWARCTQSIK